jgi:hypothetical protein
MTNQDEHECTNQLRCGLYAPLRQFNLLSHFHGDREAGILSHVQGELDSFEATWKNSNHGTGQVQHARVE